MKIHSIKYDNSLKQKHRTENMNPAIMSKEYGAGLCEENNRGYSVAFSGSGASKKTSKAAAKVFNDLGQTATDKLFRNEKFRKLVEIFEEKTVVAQSLVALGVAGVLRPATNMAMSTKEDREDAMYAASHAIASAVIGFVVSSIVMAPFDKAFKKVKNDPKKYLKGLADTLGVKEIGKRKLEKSSAYKNISKVIQMVPDTIVMGIPKAMMTIALIPPILKYVFGMEKKAKQPNKEQGPIKNLMSLHHNLVMNNIMTVDAFLKGGNK